MQKLQTTIGASLVQVRSANGSVADIEKLRRLYERAKARELTVGSVGIAGPYFVAFPGCDEALVRELLAEAEIGTGEVEFERVLIEEKKK